MWSKSEKKKPAKRFWCCNTVKWHQMERIKTQNRDNELLHHTNMYEPYIHINKDTELNRYSSNMQRKHCCFSLFLFREFILMLPWWEKQAPINILQTSQRERKEKIATVCHSDNESGRICKRLKLSRRRWKCQRRCCWCLMTIHNTQEVTPHTWCK